MTPTAPRAFRRPWFLLLFALALPALPSSLLAQGLELTRPIRAWEFFSSTGAQSSILGTENGRFEAWVYPLKLFRNFQLQFRVGEDSESAERYARRLITRPESTSILYAGSTFTVRETFFAPLHANGGLILLDVETSDPLEIGASFDEDFELMWPAGLGGSYSYWNPSLGGYELTDDQHRFFAIVGSPGGANTDAEYLVSPSGTRQDILRLGKFPKGHQTRVIAFSASFQSATEAQAEYKHLTSSYASLQQDAASYYRSYLDRTVTLSLPDSALQTDYDWARVSTLQGLVANPFLGTGLIAGYNVSGPTQRPGFAWFFGRDSLWTSLALNSEGDFNSTRLALDFIGKYQRDDGKIPHEVSQSASFVPWFKDFPFPYASADATTLYVIAMNDYAVTSGDLDFIRSKWPSIQKAAAFLKSTYDAHGLPQNSGIGHGWVEGGPLLPVKSEFYQAELGAEALRSLGNLSALLGKPEESSALQKEFDAQKAKLESLYWSPSRQIYAFALDLQDQRVESASVLATVPMWFGLLDDANAQAMITQLSSPDHQTDWGMRIIASQHPSYNPGGYHYGSVWPLFTGWASTGEYRYHRAAPAYSNLRSNALLATDGSLGHVAEVLSGDYYQPLVASTPHQIWSAAMVVSPLLRGLFGVSTNANTRVIRVAPHLPADWSHFKMANLTAGAVRADVAFERTPDGLSLEVKSSGEGRGMLEFSPALSLRAEILAVELNGKAVPFHADANSQDQHVNVRIPLEGGVARLKIRLRNDFAVSYALSLPELGAKSEGLRILSESWNAAHDQLTLDTIGAPGHTYLLNVWNPAQISRVEGATLTKAGPGATLRLASPTDGKQSVVIHLEGRKKN